MQNERIRTFNGMGIGTFALLFSAAFFTFSAGAGDFQFNGLNPDCTLRKFNGKAWVVADSKDLDGKTFPLLAPLSQDKKKAGVRVGDVWYGANFFCFQEILDTDLKVKLADEGSKKDQKVEFFERKKGEEGPAPPPEKQYFFLEITGGYPVIQGSLGKAQTEADPNSGLTAMTGKASAGPDLGIRLGLSFAEAGIAFFRVTQVTYTVKTSYSGASGGTSTADYLNRHVSFGYLYSLHLGKVKPYVGGALGWSFLKDETTFAGFTGATAGLNGALTASASGLYVAPEIGAEIMFDKWALVPNIRYDLTKTKSEKVNISTSPLLPEGTSSDSDRRFKAVTVSLGVRFIF